MYSNINGHYIFTFLFQFYLFFLFYLQFLIYGINCFTIFNKNGCLWTQINYHLKLKMEELILLKININYLIKIVLTKLRKRKMSQFK